MVPPTGSAAGAGCAAAARGAAPARRNPQDPQKRLEVVLTWLHCGQTTTPAAGAAACATGAGAAIGAAGAGCGTGAREGIIAGPAATATVPARPVAALAAAAAWAARTPWGGVWGEKGFGAASRGS